MCGKRGWRTDRSRDEVPATVATDTAEQFFRACNAEGALVGADASRRVWREIHVAALAVRPQFEHRHPFRCTDHGSEHPLARAPGAGAAFSNAVDASSHACSAERAVGVSLRTSSGRARKGASAWQASLQSGECSSAWTCRACAASLSNIDMHTNTSSL